MKKQKLSKLNEKDRPLLHLTPEIGWMNDPNGFSWYDGKYHLFYQYNPENLSWGPPRWGHAISDDLIQWQRLPIALMPGDGYDSYGCFSGTAIDTGRHMIMYTGFQLDPEEATIRGFQTQCMAFGDGIRYEKYEGNPVISSEGLPEGNDPHEFRDPKLWQEADGTFRAVLASHHEKQGAQILLYRSEDGLHWEFVKVLAQNDGKPGWMWECPDFFQMGDRYILIVSTMGQVENLCIIGDYDREQEVFTERAWHTLEQGFDLYACETMLTPDGRRVLIGWMQNPQTAEKRGIDFPINGQLSIPRELILEGDKILQRPIRELDQYRDDEIVYRNVKLESEREYRLDGVKGRTADIELSIRPDESTANGNELYERFQMRFAADEHHYTEFTYEPQTCVATMDRSQSGPGKTELVRKQAKVRDRKGLLDVRIILDKLSAEIFINDGEQVMSAVIYTDRQAEDITFYVKGTAVMDIAKYRIKENK